jgi:hypothetical protein
MLSSRCRQYDSVSRYIQLVLKPVEIITEKFNVAYCVLETNGKIE